MSFKYIMIYNLKKIRLLRYLYHFPIDVCKLLRYKITLFKLSRKRSPKELGTFKNRYLNERCFIVGLGPSLTVEDLELIKNEYCFSSNKCYQFFNRTDWRPTFFCTGDPNFARNIGKELLNISNQVKYCILNLAHINIYEKELEKKDNVFFYKTKFGTAYNFLKTESGRKKITIDLTKELDSVGTISYEMLQMAIFMGFKKIYLLGIDHNYGNGKNYSSVLYAQNKQEQKLMTTQIDVGNWTKGYQIIKKYAELHGIKIYNVTRGGLLNVYERKKLEEIVKN